MVRFSTKPLTSSRLHKLLVDGGLGYKGHSITDKLINNAHIIIAEDDELKKQKRSRAPDSTASYPIVVCCPPPQGWR